MKKKSKSRVSQETKPWLRITDVGDIFSIPTRMATRWVAGSHKDWDTKVLSAADDTEYNKLLLRSFLYISGIKRASAWRQKITRKLYTFNKISSPSRYKNYCAVLGRGRTFNRILYMARHSTRKLAGVGLISGLIK